MSIYFWSLIFSLSRLLNFDTILLLVPRMALIRDFVEGESIDVRVIVQGQVYDFKDKEFRYVVNIY